MPPTIDRRDLTHTLGSGELLPSEETEIKAFQLGYQMVYNEIPKRDAREPRDEDSEYTKEIRRMEEMNRKRVDERQKKAWEERRRRAEVGRGDDSNGNQAS